MKRDYCEGLRDSVDVVPIGAWYGQGRKVSAGDLGVTVALFPLGDTWRRTVQRGGLSADGGWLQPQQPF